MMKQLGPFFLSVLMLSSARAEGNARRGKALFRKCIECHGEHAAGKISMGAPALVNQHAWYLQRQLENIAAGLRTENPKDYYGKRMSPNAKYLKNQQAREDVVAYIKSLPPTKTRKTVKGNVDKGRKRYEMVCGACHGPKAVGNKVLNAPKLVGIQDWYLKRQYVNFREGIRGAHADDKFGGQMAFIARALDGKKIAQDVAAYIQSLQDESDGKRE